MARYNILGRALQDNLKICEFHYVGDAKDTPYLPLRGRSVRIPKGPPPASTSYHGSYADGLLEHSLNVYDHLKRLMTAYPEIGIDQESAVIAALLRDLTKVNFYTPEKRAKSMGGLRQIHDQGKVLLRWPWEQLR